MVVQRALQYFWSLILVAVVMVGVLVVFVIVVDQTYWVELCEKENIDIGQIQDCTSDTTRYIFVGIALAQLFITIVCCVRPHRASSILPTHILASSRRHAASAALEPTIR